MAIEQIIGAVLERAIKAWKVETLQQRRALGVGPQPIDHLFGRHHQFEQRRNGRDPPCDEVEIVANIVEAEAIIGVGRVVPREFVHAIAEPMVVRFPILFAYKMSKGTFNRLKPTSLAGQVEQTHKRKGGLAVILNNRKRLLQFEEAGKSTGLNSSH